MTNGRPPRAGGSLSKALGELDEHAPVGRILDFVECDDEAQTFNDVQIDL